jgi:hypothetical protein
MASPGHFQLLHLHSSINPRKIKPERFVFDCSLSHIHRALTDSKLFFGIRIGIGSSRQQKRPLRPEEHGTENLHNLITLAQWFRRGRPFLGRAASRHVGAFPLAMWPLARQNIGLPPLRL